MKTIGTLLRGFALATLLTGKATVKALFLKETYLLGLSLIGILIVVERNTGNLLSFVVKELKVSL